MSGGCMSLMSPNGNEARHSFSLSDDEDDVKYCDSAMDLSQSWHTDSEMNLPCGSTQSLENQVVPQAIEANMNSDIDIHYTQPNNQHGNNKSSNLLYLNGKLGITQLYCPRTANLVDARAALQNKTLLIYFSAAWCKPCKQFTPLLKGWYHQRVVPSQVLHGSSNVEVLFVSLDHMKFNYDEYTNDMPWMCLSFKDAYSKRDELMSLYKVEGIPQVVVMSPEGEIWNWDATPAITEDPVGNNFPWKRESLEDLLMNQNFTLPVPDISQLTQNSNFSPSAHPFCRLVGNDYDNYQLDKKYLILYFCASWCDACVDFTPLICDTFKKMKAQRDDFEMIHVSLDEDEAGFNKFVSHLPCLSISFSELACRSKITSLCNISSIPTVLILGPVPGDGSARPIIHANARQLIASNYLSNLKNAPFDQTADGTQLALSNPCDVRHIERLLPPAISTKPNLNDNQDFHKHSPVM